MPAATLCVSKYCIRVQRALLIITQDPDYSVEIEVDHPEFKKLAFTSPGPKNAFAPLQRSGYGRQHHVMADGWGGERKEDPTGGVASSATTESEFDIPLPPSLYCS